MEGAKSLVSGKEGKIISGGDFYSLKTNHLQEERERYETGGIGF